VADQHRWFKLWATAPWDDDLQQLPPAHRWAWVVLGVYTKTNGTRGRVTISPSNATLCGAMCVTSDALEHVIRTFPHVRVEEGNNDNGKFTVTWDNWTKYQEDASVYERVRRLRSKRRGEENRGDEKRTTALRAVAQHAAGITFHIPASVLAALDRAPILGHIAKLRDPRWWQAQLRANHGVDLAGEVLKAEAWLTSNPARAPKKSHERFLHSWLGRAERSDA
jgi:hypothetical protein